MHKLILFAHLCRLGAYVLLSALTCIALDVVSGPQQVARLPDPKQLEIVRAAAQRRKSMAQLQLQRAAERSLRRKSMSSLGEATRDHAEFHSCRLRFGTQAPTAMAETARAVAARSNVNVPVVQKL